MALALPRLPVGALDGPGAAPPHCPRCDYLLANIPEDRCPECGLGYSLLAVERVDRFIGIGLVRGYQVALCWSIAGLFLAVLPLAVPRANATAFLWIAVMALVTPTLVGMAQSLRAFAREWATPAWVWFGPLIGVLFLAGVIFPLMLVLSGLGASAMGGLALLRMANVPEVLAPLDSRAGRRLRRWRMAAWATLSLGLIVQLSLIARFR